MMARTTTVTGRLLLCAALLGAAVPVGARAQTADPTLPPPNLLPAGAAPAESAPPAGPELQSVLVSREPGGRRLAVISGETVRQGGRFRGALVERVDENEVVLRRGRTREVLRLYGKPAGKTAEQR